MAAQSSRIALLEAMVRAVGHRGYAGASVARVVEEAGVSRATFYEHFNDRDDCFQATCELAIKQRLRMAVDACRSGSMQDPAHILQALLATAVKNQPEARLLIVEALASPPAVRLQFEPLIAGAERILGRLFDRYPRDGGVLQIPVSAIFGAFASVAAIRLLRGEAESLPSLHHDLCTWASAYLVPADEHAWRQDYWPELGKGIRPATHRKPEEAPLLARGPSALDRSAVAAIRRQRIIAGTQKAVTAKGYADATVADIVTAARVSRGAFYAHFGGKMDAFLAAQTAGLQESIAVSAAEFALGEDWPDSVWRGLGALLRYVAANPEMAWLGIVEIQAAGAGAMLRDHEYRMAYTLFLQGGYQERPGRHISPLFAELISAAIHAMIRREIVAGRTAQLPRLLPQCAYVAMTPFTGPGPAADFVEARARAAG